MKAKRRLWILAVACLLLTLLVNVASAENFFDYSEDKNAFRETLHMVHSTGDAVPRGEGDTSGPMVTLVMRTNGQTPDTTDCPPASIIAGPYNMYLALYPTAAEAELAIEILSAQEGMRYCCRDRKLSYLSTDDAEGADEDEVFMEEPIEPIDGSGPASELYPEADLLPETDADWTQVPEVTEEEENTPVSSSSVSFLSHAAKLLGADKCLPYVQAAYSGSETVGVIDSGVYKHTFMSSRIKTGGYDYVDGDSSPFNDANGHGTHVAGTIADLTQGLPVYIFPVRTLDAEGSGWTSDAASAVLDCVSAGCSIINMSLGGGHDPAVDDAIATAISRGVTVVVSAGNDNESTANSCPAHITSSGCIVVGATTDSGTKSSYSNYGSSVDIWCYGDDIRSCATNSTGYCYKSGTSMAAPHISAICAYMELLSPGISASATATWLKEIVKTSTSRAIPDLTKLIPTDVGVGTTTLNLRTGTQLQLMTSARPATSKRTITFSSSNTSVATVTSGGLLKCVGTGTATITIKASNYLTKKITLTVASGTGRNVTIPARVTRIEPYTFYNDDAVRNVWLPSGLTYIGNYAFAYCGGLKTLYLPNSVTSISSTAFSNATKPVILCPYGGTAMNWAINNGFSWLAIVK